MLGVADVSEVLNKSLSENTLMRQRRKEIVKCNMLGTRKLIKYVNDYSQPILSNNILRQEYFSANIANGLYYELDLNF